MIKHICIGLFFGIIAICYITTDNAIIRNRTKLACVLMLIAIAVLQIKISSI